MGLNNAFCSLLEPVPVIINAFILAGWILGGGGLPLSADGQS